MTPQILEAHDTFASMLISKVPERFEQIVVNAEALKPAPGIDPDVGGIFFFVTPATSKRFGLKRTPRKRKDIKPDLQVFDGLDKLYKLYETQGDAWGSFTLIIESDGRFNFDFDYGPPKRMNGIHDEQSYDRFVNWIDNM